MSCAFIHVNCDDVLFPSLPQLTTPTEVSVKREHSKLNVHVSLGNNLIEPSKLVHMLAYIHVYTCVSSEMWYITSTRVTVITEPSKVVQCSGLEGLAS